MVNGNESHTGWEHATSTLCSVESYRIFTSLQIISYTYPVGLSAVLVAEACEPGVGLHRGLFNQRGVERLLALQAQRVALLVQRLYW